jgi:Fe2+ or Zn2+ uptake regulation protein
MKPESHEIEEHAMPADLRMTPQRREVYEVLRASHDHPTASEVFSRAKERVPGISLATVYNCLDALVDHGVIKQVNLDRASSRYCANLNDHVHFHCDECGAVSDADLLDEVTTSKLWRLPEGSKVTRLDVAIRGLCPECAKKSKSLFH